MEIINGLIEKVVFYLPSVIGALLILLAGFIIGKLFAAAVRGLLGKTNLDNRIANAIGGERSGEPPFAVEKLISTVIFYFIMLMAVVMAAEALQLTAITNPLNSLLGTVLDYVPKLFGAAVLIGVAWLVATAAKMLITNVLGSTTLDEKFNRYVGDDSTPSGVNLGKTIGDAAYWLIWLFFLPGILNALQIDGLQPVQNMVNSIMGFIPNLFAAAVILVIGWFVARLVQRIISGFLAAFGIDNLGARLGLDSVLGEQKLSALIGMIAYVLIFLPIVVAALDSLKLDALTAPVSRMLDSILGALPNLFGAALILAISYVIGRMVANLIANLLAGMGFDGIMGRLGLSGMMSEGGRTPSELVGALILFGIMLFATIEAASILGFGMIAGLVTTITAFFGQVVLGIIIMAIGLYLANIAANAVRSSKTPNANLLANVARIAILLLTGAMGLRQMGIANEIINLAFGLALGSVAVASAIAFGLGGWRPASRKVEQWMKSLEDGS